MNQRQQQKKATRDRIVDAAAGMVRRQGAARTGVADVMAAAGLTHGGFYAHFGGKDQLLAEAVTRATEHRQTWLNVNPDAPESERLAEVARRYLNDAHRRHPEDGCPYPGLLSEVPHLSPAVRDVLRRETSESIATLAGQLDDDAAMTADDKARAMLALLVGAMQLARLYDDREAAHIMAAARRLAVRAGDNHAPTSNDAEGEEPRS